MLKSRNSFIKLTTAIFATTLMMTLGALALFTEDVHATGGYPYIDASGNETETDPGTPVTELTDNTATTLDSGWYVVNRDINYNSTLTFNGEVYLILVDECTMTIQSARN